MIRTDVVEKIGKAMSEKDITVEFRGTRAYTNGSTIVLPSIPENMSETVFNKIRGYIDHEAGHVKFSSFDSLKLPEMENPNFRNLVNVIEDIRVEKLVAEKYFGSKTNFENLLNTLIEEKEMDLTNPLVALNLEGRKRVNGFNINCPDVSEDVKSFFGEDIFERISLCDSTQDVFELVKSIFQQEEQEEETEENSETGEGEGDSKEQKDTEQETGENSETGDSNEDNEDDETDEDGEIDEDDETDEDGEIDETDETDEGDEGDETEKETEDVGEGKTEGSKFDKLGNYEDIYNNIKEELTKKTKDYLKRNYIPYSKSSDKFMTVKEADNLRTYNQLLKDCGSLVSYKMKVANMFLSEKAVKWELGKKNGKINNSALARVKTGATDVFKTKRNTECTNTAITLLIDFSGSMSRGKIDDAMKTVVLFAELLAHSKVKVEILGFTTYGWVKTDYITEEELNKAEKMIYDGRYEAPNFSRYNPIAIYNFKGFDEVFNTKVKKRISSYKSISLEHNVDGECLEIAYNRILQRPEKRKILFVLSDGRPEANGSMEKLHNHLKDVTKKIENENKVELVGFGILTDAVKDYYSKNIIIGRSSNLAKVVIEQLEKILL